MYFDFQPFKSLAFSKTQTPVSLTHNEKCSGTMWQSGSTDEKQGSQRQRQQSFQVVQQLKHYKHIFKASGIHDQSCRVTLNYSNVIREKSRDRVGAVQTGLEL